MEMEIPVMTGYLNISTQSGFPLNRISKKKSYQRFCLLFKASRHGIERLELCESKDDKNPKIITLENCVKITQEPSPANLIQIVKKTETLTINTLTDIALKEWLNALQTVAFSDKNERQDNFAIEEDNDLYYSSFDEGIFIVTLIPSSTSVRCNLEPKVYIMHLTSTDIQLKSPDDLSIIVAIWPYRFIRKYGYRDGKFTFEAGRKCHTGEGIFTLSHPNPQEIFRCMSSKMKLMKRFICSESSNNPECSEINAVACMEAGSRSPFPASTSHQNVAEFEVKSNQSCISMQGFISSSESLNSISLNSTTDSSSKVQPGKSYVDKSLRKLPTTMEKSALEFLNTIEFKSHGQNQPSRPKNFSNYEPVSITTSIDPNKTAGSTVILNHVSSNSTPLDPTFQRKSRKLLAERNYESIESITDAWKTLGISDIKHTERTVAVVDDECVNIFLPKATSVRERKRMKEQCSSKLIDIDIGEDEHCENPDGINFRYDRLDFMTPNNKASSGYKTIVTLSTNAIRMCCSSPASNDYELIESPDIQPCHLGSDGHLGYGVLRNSLCSSHLSNSRLSSSQLDKVNMLESVSNEETLLEKRTANLLGGSSETEQPNYAIISKPKRV